MKIELSVYVDETGAVKAFYDVDGESEVTDAQKELCYTKLAEVITTKMTTDAENHKITKEIERHVSVTKLRAEVELAEASAETQVANHKASKEAEVKLAETSSEVEIRKLNYEADTTKRKIISENHVLFLGEAHAKFLDVMKKDE